MRSWVFCNAGLAGLVGGTALMSDLGRVRNLRMVNMNKGLVEARSWLCFK